MSNLTRYLITQGSKIYSDIGDHCDYDEADAELERLKLALQGRTVSCEACNDMAKKLADIGAVVEEEETYILEDSCDESKFFSYKLDKIKSILEGEGGKV